ncbi:MAG: hypothetical protein ACOH2R_11290 [Pseudomonas sp.]
MNNAIKALLPAPAMQNLHDPSGIGFADTVDPHVPLSVRVGPYANMAVGDVIDLYCDDALVFNYTIKEGDLPPETPSYVVLELKQQYIHPDQITLFYKVTEPVGGVHNQSIAATVRVKLTIPGGTDINPSTPWENEALDKATVLPPGIITSPEGVSVTIAPYKNMEVGDRITLSWHGEFVRYQLKAQEEVGQPVVLPISKEVIDAAGDSDMLEVRYEIRDVVNNWSRWSLPTYIEVEAGNSTLPAPVAPQAANMELNLTALAGADVQGLVLSYPGIAPTDEITFTVERNTAEGMVLQPYITAKAVGGSVGFVEFLIPNEQFAPLTQGRARLRYKVKKASGEEERSKSLQLAVVGETQVLAPPKLPVAEQNGGVLDPASRNVIAQVPAYYFMADGNDVMLVWMGKTAGGGNVIHEEVKNLNSDDVGRTLEFLIPDDKVSALAGGSLELYYTVTTFARAFFKSPSLHVPVSADGGGSLPAPSVDNASADGVLDPADIVLEAVVRIQPYVGMAPLDKVTLQWSGRVADGSYSAYTTLNSGTVGREVIFRVGKSYVDANLNGNVDVSYEVQRGNRTFKSENLPLRIGSAVITPLPDPTVKEAKADNTLDPADTANGATVVVGVSANLKVGDVVSASWLGAGGSDTKEKLITNAEVGKALEIIFASALVIANVGNRVRIYYEVKRSNGTIGRSADLEVLVTTGLANLPAAAVTGVDANGILIPEQVPESGVAVTVPRYTNMAVADSIVVKWTGGSVHTTAPQVVDAVAELNFSVPKAVATGSAGSVVTVTYAVTRGSVAPVESLETKFTVQALAPPLEFGSDHALSLAGYLVAEGRPPLNPPASAIYERAASGGTPPYTYSSSNPLCALVDSAGKVTAAGNGVTTITVTDSLANTASYQLTAAGARVFALLDQVPRDHAGYQAACAQNGVHAMNRGDFAQLYNVYRGESLDVSTLLGWPNGCWTNEQVKPGSTGYLRNAYLFALNVGEVMINVHYVNHSSICIRA